MSLPIYQDPNKNLMLLQTQWSSQLNPVISTPIVDSSIVSNVSLTPGTNSINHLLGRKLQGWSLVRQRGPATIYDNQDNNQMSNLTLILISSAAVSVDILVF